MGLEELVPGWLQRLADKGRHVDEEEAGPNVAQVLQVSSDTNCYDAVGSVFLILSDTSVCLKMTLGDTALESFHNDELCIGKLIEVHAVVHDSMASCPMVTELLIREDLGRHPTIGNPKVIFSASSACNSRSTTANSTPTETSIHADPATPFGKWGSLTSTNFPVLHSVPNTPLASPKHDPAHLPFDTVASACSSLINSVNTVADALPASCPRALAPTLANLGSDISKLSVALDSLSEKLTSSLSTVGKDHQTPGKALSPLVPNLASSLKKTRSSVGPTRVRPTKVHEEKERPIQRSRSAGLLKAVAERKREKENMETAAGTQGTVAPIKQPAWMRSKMYQPSEVPAAKCERQLKLSLKHIYGYKGGIRGTETIVSNNLAVTKKDLVYCVSGLVVLQSLHGEEQRFFAHHNDDIVCLAQHPARRHVFATSSLSASKPQLVVWDSNDVRKPYRTIPCNAGKGVLLMCFSKGGLLGTVSSDSQNTLTIWDWLKEQIVCTAPTGKDSGQIKGIAFSPYEDKTLITYGANHLRKWNVSTTLGGKLAIYGKKGDTQSILCHHYFADKLLVGTSEGSLLTFGTSIDGILKLTSSTKEAHKGPVLSATGLSDANQVATSGRDSVVKIWVRTEVGIVLSKCIPLAKDSPIGTEVCLNSDEAQGRDLESIGGVASMVTGTADTLFLGTTTNKLIEVSTTRTPITKVLSSSHNKVGEFRALAAHPTDPFFVTGSDDRTVRVWRYDTKQFVKEVSVRGRVRTLSYSPDGKYIAVGYSSGCFEVFCSSLTEDSIHSTIQQKIEIDEDSIDPLEVVEDCPVDKKQEKPEAADVTVLEYSPCGDMLAVGFRSSCVDLFKVSEGFCKVGVCRAHHGAVKSIDWSVDSSVLQVSTTSNELLHFTSSGAHIVHPHQFRDMLYSNWTSPLGWCTMGLWDPAAYTNASEVSSLAASATKSIMIASDVHGKLIYSTFPLPAASKSKRVFRGHSAAVSKIVLTPSSSTLLSIGNIDRCIFCWSVS
eukprot:TRINITY_DN8346_c0_g1_i2.p1 TRINITY_DN8346_c0_g1~~TRINITY_DN8346_c0_g1_i2.p1  ORF type:complete len:1004 (+),score=210.67 TRINITY_DN8346_c0_g1_i2:41-3052(+)